MSNLKSNANLRIWSKIVQKVLSSKNCSNICDDLILINRSLNATCSMNVTDGQIEMQIAISVTES